MVYDTMMQTSSGNIPRISSIVSGIQAYLTRTDWLLFLILIAGLACVYDYPEILFKRPQAVHAWRQCDGASLALNYYQNGMHFFRPETHGLFSDHGTTGRTAPSEFPLLYFFVAILYKIFGYHEYIFRAATMLLFFLGLFYLFKLAREILRSFYAIAVPVLLFTSPLIVYYANNFMPNPVALTFSIIGWYYFYTYTFTGDTKKFLLAILFFTIAGLMKVTELSGPIIVLIFMVADRYNLLDLHLNARNQFLLKMGAMTGLFILVAGWILFARHYNAEHGSNQFATFIYPFWNIDAPSIRLVFHKMNVIWLQEYYWPPTLYFIMASIICLPFLLKFTNRILTLVVLLYFFGFFVFSMLWFELLGDHDYFLTGFYILPAFVFILVFRLFENIKKTSVFAYLLKAIVIAFVVFNVLHARDRLKFRYNSWMNDYASMQDIYTIGPYLNQLGINKNDSIVYFASLNIRPLYLMNLKGWTLRDYNDISPRVKRTDSLMMKKFVTTGAKYLITDDINALARHTSILPYTENLFGKYRGIFIFRIPPQEKNFVLSDTLKTLLSFSCNVEKTDRNGQFAWCSDSVHLVRTGGLIATDKARSGSNSVVVDPERPYGLSGSYLITSFDHVTVSVYQYPPDANCYLVVSSRHGNVFYFTSQESIKGSDGGWNKILCTADIPASYENDSIAVYFWNAGKNKVYIDDLEFSIQRRTFMTGLNSYDKNEK